MEPASDAVAILKYVSKVIDKLEALLLVVRREVQPLGVVALSDWGVLCVFSMLSWAIKTSFGSVDGGIVNDIDDRLFCGAAELTDVTQYGYGAAPVFTG